MYVFLVIDSQSTSLRQRNSVQFSNQFVCGCHAIAACVSQGTVHVLHVHVKIQFYVHLCLYVVIELLFHLLSIRLKSF